MEEKIKILLCEDDEKFRYVASRIFAGKGIYHSSVP